MAAGIGAAALGFFLVIAMVQAMSFDYDRRQKWWLLGALGALVLAGVLLPRALERYFPQATAYPHFSKIDINSILFYS